MSYEKGMLIMHDVVGKSVFVEFRGEFFTLPGPFSTRAAGIAAGEQHCRTLGWKGHME